MTHDRRAKARTRYDDNTYASDDDHQTNYPPRGRSPHTIAKFATARAHHLHDIRDNTTTHDTNERVNDQMCARACVAWLRRQRDETSSSRRPEASSVFGRNESPSKRLSLNRSQRGNCSTEYNTPPGTKVVYRLFRASTSKRDTHNRPLEADGT